MSGLSLPRSTSPSVHSTSPTETAPTHTHEPVQTPSTPTQQHSEQFAGLRRARSASDSHGGATQTAQGRRRGASLGSGSAPAATTAATSSAFTATTAAGHDTEHRDPASETPPTPEAQTSPQTQPAPQTPHTAPVSVSAQPLMLHEAASDSNLPLEAPQSQPPAGGTEMARSSSAGASAASTAPLVPLAPLTSTVAASTETVAKEPLETPKPAETVQTAKPLETAQATTSAKESEPSTPLGEIPERNLTLQHVPSDSHLAQPQQQSAPAANRARSSSTGASAGSTAPLEPFELPTPLAPAVAASSETVTKEPVETAKPLETVETPKPVETAETAKTPDTAKATTSAAESEPSTPLGEVPERNLTLQRAPSDSHLPLTEPQQQPASAANRARSSSVGGTTASTAPLEPLEPLEPPPLHTTPLRQASPKPVTQNEPSSSETALQKTAAPPITEHEASTSQEIAPKTKEPETSVIDFGLKQEPSSEETAPAPLLQTPQTPHTPVQTHLAPPKPTHLAPPKATVASTSTSSAAPSTSDTNEITVAPRRPGEAHLSQMDTGGVQNFIRNSRMADQGLPTSTVRLGNRRPGADLEAATTDTRGRFEQTRSRIGAFTKPAGELMSGAKSGLIRIGKNDFGPEDPAMGWISNFANSFTHEIPGTAFTTGVVRELAGGLGMQAIIEATHMSPEARSIGVGTVFFTAVAGNLAAMWYKNNKGQAISTTNRGHLLQIGALVGSGVAATLVGRGSAGGPVIATLLPSAIKSVLYLSRDWFNLHFPLDGNHDADYKRPVLGQALDVSYLATEEYVNAGQDDVGLGGAGALDAVKDHTTSLRAAVGKLSAYSFLNASGEALANISARVANEVSAHNFNSAETWKGVRDLRLSWGRYSSENGSYGSQFAGKMAGAGIARLSLFLSLYALSGVLGHVLSGTNLNAKTQARMEEVLGALMIIAGCIPFAMSTTSKPADPQGTITELSDEDEEAAAAAAAATTTAAAAATATAGGAAGADDASVVVTPPNANLTPDRLSPNPSQHSGGLRPRASSGASINTVSSNRPSFEVP